MRQAVACPECGRSLSTNPATPAEGCPFCLAFQALSEVEVPQASAPSPKSASRLGKYIIAEKLGSGAMGEVWKAWDSELERWVALKLLRHDDPHELERFTREAKTAAGLSHPHIAAVYEAGKVAGRHFIAMQLIEGRTLEQVPRKDIRRLVLLVRDAAEAVGFAHRNGIIHRDLKPANLMESGDESNPRGVVMDFGLARKIEGAGKLSRTGAMAGTPAYMSPEQSRGRKADARSDVYSLGVSLYELLTGRLPYHSKDLYELLRKITDDDPVSPSKLDRRIDRDMETVILKCLEKDPAARYGKADALARDLDRWLAGEPVLARRSGSLARIGRALSKRKAMAGAVAAALIAAAFGIGWLVTGKRDSRHAELTAVALTAWAEARGEAMAGVHRAAIARKARIAREKFEAAAVVLDDSRNRLMRARCLQLEGRSRDARNLLERAHQLDGAHVDVRIDLAKVLLEEHRSLRGLPTWDVLWHQSMSNLKYVVVRGSLPPETPDLKRLRERSAELLQGCNPAPERPDALRGLLAMSCEEYSTASAHLSRYTGEERWDVSALRLEGICRHFAGDYSGAAAVIDVSLQRVPNAAMHVIRGDAARGLNDLDSALEHYTRAHELEPAEANHVARRASAYEDRGLWSEAVKEYTKALELAAPSSEKAGWIRGRRGFPRFTLYEDEAAIGDFEEAARWFPDKSVYPVSIGAIHLRAQRFDLAIGPLTKAVTLDNKSAKALFNRGSCHSQLGLLDKAEADLKAALALDGNYADAMCELGQVHELRENWVEAEQMYSAAIRIEVRHAHAYHRRGRVHSRTGRPEQAIKDYVEAIRLDPKFPNPHADLGGLYYNQDKLEESVRHLQDALKIAPKDWPDSSRRLVTCLLRLWDAWRLRRQEKWKEAIAVFEEVIKDYPDQKGHAAESAYNIAINHGRLGNESMMVDWLEKCAEMGYREPAIIRHLETSSTFEHLRKQERFQRILSALKENLSKK